jgi:methionine-rich copper-binding protein CopC
MFTMIAVRTRVARRGTRVCAGVVLLVAACTLTPGGVLAHDAHVESDPASGSQLDEAITEIHFEFDEPIGDDTEIAVFDPNEVQLDSETTLVSETAAVVTFDEIDVEGDYIARYLTSSIDDGHLLAGAISFTYGSPPSGPSTLQWVVMCVGAIAILSIGAFFSFRRYRALSTDDAIDSEVDDNLSDVGV